MFKDKKTFAKMFDHTILKADASKAQVTKLCNEALEYGFASVCVNSCHTKLVAGMLEGSDIKTCVVVGFPLGAMSTAAKASETKDAVSSGAQEIDMVINVGALKDKDYQYVENDIKAVVAATGKKASVKVIIETCLLTDDEKVKACEIAKTAGADYVKTSTGFSTGGATASDIALMRKTVGADMGVKASGGIRDYESSVKMINAGASRIGASATVEIINK
ncbi:deoxyribose-phosphate aldolase 1 [Ruminiclostridium hungatei]|uniref:Deoxyribose-phosphate aldolase n=1 Tax=Ruminiclostridium hungatei TaxID=48256 RepID=A0A1V4SFY4_RUMHU|nr:deoxyribose-phosphate aldolase [Ruminiclostridium hungatei]OPX42778.1 deoxyribose-phosphate aldolase 1 [Ruminiclostridium hungatei]